MLWPVQHEALLSRAVNRACTKAKRRESLLVKQDSVLLRTFSCSETRTQLTNHQLCKQRLESSELLQPNHTLWRSAAHQKRRATQSFSASELIPSALCKQGARAGQLTARGGEAKALGEAQGAWSAKSCRTECHTWDRLP